MATDKLWTTWMRDWQRMQAIAIQRGWDVTRLSVAPPLPEAELRQFEQRTGLPVPLQLRELLTNCSACVSFGWQIPWHLQALETVNQITTSTNFGSLWDLERIEFVAIPNFLELKRALATQDVSAAHNSEEMWEQQFPLYDLPNGDVVTIDMRRPEGPHPVRYLSHELDMLHGLALAPDLFGFITQMSMLGFAGTEWASWLSFGHHEVSKRAYYLTADSPGGKSWLAWLAKKHTDADPDEPPPTLVEATPVDRGLLDAARQGHLECVIGALARGAKPDVVYSQDWLAENQLWNDEFATALNYAVMDSNIEMCKVLLTSGATLNTRRLLMADAVSKASLAMVVWLVQQGARVNGWRGTRYWPLHLLVTKRSRVTATSPEALNSRLRAQYSGGLSDFEDGLIKEQARTWLDRPSYLQMLDILLKAGAFPDTRWDNGSTMLMWSEADDAAFLLGSGADVHARDSFGSQALHSCWAWGGVEKIRVLVAFGADVDALKLPEDATDYGCTPLQEALLMSSRRGLSLVQALLELGADPFKRDTGGRSSLCYATSIEGFNLMLSFGLDPMERLPDGGSLLHNLYTITNGSNGVAMLDHLLTHGLPINGTNKAGHTVLHIAAKALLEPEDFALLLDRGADKSIRDMSGKRAIDLIPRSQRKFYRSLA